MVSGAARAGYDRGDAYRTWNELNALALAADYIGDANAARRYRTIAERITGLSPLLSAAYFDPASGAFRGQLDDENGSPIQIEGLRGISFGNGQNAGPTNKLFFASAPDDETHGLFGTLEAQ